MLVEQGDLGGARGRYQESLEIRKHLTSADASSATLQRDVSVSLDRLGDILVAQSDLIEARGRYQKSLEIRKRLAAAAPSSAALQRDLIVSLVKLSEILKDRTYAQQALDIALKLQEIGRLAHRDSWMVE